MAYLEIRAGGPRGKRFGLTDENTLGRAEGNTLRFEREDVSRFHARIARTETGHVVHHLGSRNGLFVNGQPVERQRLVDGDRIQVGPVLTLRFCSGRATGRVVWVPDLDGETRTVAAGATRVDDADRLHALYQLGLALLEEELAPERLRERAATLLLETLGADRCAILLGDGPDSLAPVAVVWRDDPGSDAPPMPVSRRLAALTLGEGRAVLCNQLAGDARFAESRSLAGHGIASLVAAPLARGMVVLDTLLPGRPFSDQDLETLVAAAAMLSGALAGADRYGAARDENHRLRTALEGELGLIGESPGLRAVLDQVVRVAPSDASVLLLGETGTGKELVARAIHRASPRSGGPFVAVNCGAIPATLMESELFGHEQGAFTGADRRKIGQFEAASGGTLFLDEIGEMPSALQAGLLRVLQERRLTRVGGIEPVAVDVRVVSATHRDLQADVAAGRFREDLYYRLHVVPIAIPPLRERTGDIPRLAQAFLDRFSRAAGRPRPSLTEEALAALQLHAWPGNVRELENLIQRLVVMSEGDTISVEQLPAGLIDGELAGELAARIEAGGLALAELVAWVERVCILRAFALTPRKIEAARLLQISRPTLDRKLKAYGIDPDPTS